MKNIDGQLSIWDVMQQEAPEELVEIKGAINTKSYPISEHEVRLAYGDLVLIVAMVEDYVKGLDEIKQDDILWNSYYHDKFKKISENIQEQIDYDYEKAKEKCLKKKEKASDVGEEALVLAVKHAPKPKKKEESEDESNEEKQDGNTN